MNCHEFRQLLERGIEDRSSWAEGVRQHVAECPDPDCTCASMLRNAETLDAVIEQWRAARPQVDVVDRVASAWRNVESTSIVRAASTMSSSQRLRGHDRRSAVTVALCALGVLVLAVAVLSTASRQPRPVADAPVHPEAVTPLKHRLATADPGEHQETDDDPEEALETVGRSYVGLVQNATNVVSDMVALAFCGDQDLEDPTAAVDWVDDWKQNLQPVRDEVDGTVDEILETIPNQRLLPETWLLDLPT